MVPKFRRNGEKGKNLEFTIGRTWVGDKYSSEDTKWDLIMLILRLADWASIFQKLI